jgi:pimeloyl-ACP methyl ester carboxylesterase
VQNPLTQACSSQDRWHDGGANGLTNVVSTNGGATWSLAAGQPQFTICAGAPSGNLVLNDRFPLADQLAAVDAPVTVVYGTGDTIVPAEQSRAVANAAPNLRQLVAVEGADHNDPALLDGDPPINAVVALADHAGQKP